MATTKKKKTAFDLLPKKEKRIVILKDALRHLKAQRIKTHKGSVLLLDRRNPVELFTGDLKKILRRQKQCRVCQRGALLFSLVYRNNNLTLDPGKCFIGHWGQDGLRGIAGDNNQDDIFLRKIFSLEQLMLMERAFEGRYHYYPNGGYESKRTDGSTRPSLEVEDAEAALNFYYRFQEDTNGRTEAILKNAIKNGGIFKP